MLMHTMAPSRVGAPALYARYTWVTGMGLRWEDVGGIDEDEIGHLARLINILQEGQALKSRVASKG